jgi:lysophospholipase L1-like esterase
VVAVGAGLLVGCLLSELLVLTIAGEQPKFPRHVVRAPWGLRYNDPGSSYRHKSADITTYFSINREGMRSDRDFTYEKTPGVIRIVSLGDSFTIGFEVDLEQCFSSVLERELRDAGLDVEVLNAGVSGYSNAEELLYLERELIKYAPDLVLLSFYGNDVEENVRTNLFGVEEGRLVARNPEYVPGGTLANYLNTNGLFNLLSERSNAFALLTERLTDMIKRDAIEDVDARVLMAGETEGGTAQRRNDPSAELTAAIFERLYAFLRLRNIPLVIQSIPVPAQALPPGATHGPGKMVDLFPLDRFDVHRPGLYFVSAKEFLQASSDTHLLYWTRSHVHWTPFSHAASGRRLAELILREQLLARHR